MKIKLHVLITTALFVLTGCNGAKNTELNPTFEIVGESSSDNNVVIKLAVSNFESYTFEKELIEKFNADDNGYYIQVVDYCNIYDINSEDTEPNKEAYAKADQRIIDDIMNNNNIDMMLNLLNGERVITLAQKGLFANINDFIEKDPNFEYQELNNHVLNACEIDDALYYMPLGYTINTMYGYEKYVGAIDEWNLSTMKSRWEQMPENSVFSREHICGGDNAENIFFDLCMRCTSSFLNPETNKCNFDSDEYIELLKFANSFASEGVFDKSEFVSEDFFLANASINGFARYKEYLFNEGIPEKLSFVGYPSKDSSYSFFNLCGNCEICAKAPKDVQNGAWEFMKYLINENTQYKNYFPDSDNEQKENDFGFSEEQSINIGFPINNVAFEKKGNELISAPKGNNTIGIAGNTFDMGNLTKEELTTLEDIINHTNYVEFGIYKLYDIIYEEIGEMLNGTRTPEQTANMIQNRVSIMMNE